MGEGNCAVYCAKNRIPYLGFCLTDLHAKMANQHVISELLASKFTAGEKLFNPELAKLLKMGSGQPGTTPSSSSGKKPKTKPDGADAAGKAEEETPTDPQSVLEAFKKKLASLKKEEGAGDEKEEEET